MKKIEPDYIKKLIDIMNNNELTEITLDDGENSLVIKGSGYKPVVKQEVVEETSQEIQEEVIEEEPKKNLVPVVSQMIGIFYSKPSPNEVPFVKVGDEVKEGQIVCIIETIKLMNKITSEVSGKVAEICIEDGKPVEYGQVMMYIEKN